MKQTKKYWKGLEQLNNTDSFKEKANKEFAEYLPIAGTEDEEPSRRDFLKLMGFGLAAVSLAACETPIRKAIPYVRKPESIDPSNANYYASTYVNGSDYCSVLVKTREGRPIKIEGNALSKVSGGGTSSQAQASVLSLYDKERLTAPLVGGKNATWAELDAAVIKELASARSIALVSNSISSPSTLAAIAELKNKYTNVNHVQYDQVSFDALNSAYEKAFGTRFFPTFNFGEVKTIVSFGYDFLGSAPNATLNSKDFAKTRKLGNGKTEMSRLYSFESNLSLTGANADYRTPIKPSQEGVFVANLYNELASKVGASTISIPKVEDNVTLKKAASDLLLSKGKSLVLSGSNDINIQLVIIAINDLLQNYGTTIDVNRSWKQRNGSDKDFAAFAKSLKSGEVDAVIFYNCNPVYDHPLGSLVQEGIAKAKFSLSTSDRKDETSVLVKYQAPDHHFLESWNDFEPISGSYSLSQPTIKNIFDTRQAQESFLVWSGSEKNYYDYMRSMWETYAYPQAVTMFSTFDAFWDKCIHDGVYEAPLEPKTMTVSVDVSGLGSELAKLNNSDSSNIELTLYQNYSVGDGTQANNPWLQEMPDPITKATWDNYLTVSPKQAEELGVKIDDMKTQLAKLTVGNKTIEVPVLPQPGQAYGTVGLAIGYGRTSSGKVANGVGVNAYELASTLNGNVSFSIASGISVELTSTEYSIAQTQTHHTYMGRETVIQEALLKDYQKDPQAGRNFPTIATAKGPMKPYAVSLWKGHAYPNHHWGLMIDLNSCTGCGSCTVACQVENNIPVVGKQEVLNRREMHWIRIDRYYSSDATEGNAMENPAENPEVTFQPMMCQQCNNAPCETVCPVAATTHSSEGLNQMTYNRCIGTRYCANNCPYKVRRFNWFKYHDNKQFDKNMAMNNDLGKMVLNPDVTVRARGVMEKCTFCVQRIQAGKLEAKKEGRRPNDSDVTTACASACPSEALVFGDMKNPESKISQMLKIKNNEKSVESEEPRAYHVLEEIRVMPNVWYLTKIRNKDEKVKEGAEA
jgi:MoCo/4Fe-4S cofactor protein with predicted Tat translocation signal